MREDEAQELFAYAVVLATSRTPYEEAVADLLEHSGRDVPLLIEALELARSKATLRVPGAPAAARLFEAAVKALED